MDLTHLEYLSLASNKIKSLPSNVFGNLLDLRGLYLNSNLIQEFSHLLLKRNLKLDEVWLQDNQLELISSNMSEAMPHLKNIYLTGNICISKDFRDITEKNVMQVKKEIAMNCSNQCEPKMIEVAECNEKYFELELENENLKKEIEKIRKFLKSVLVI